MQDEHINFRYDAKEIFYLISSLIFFGSFIYNVVYFNALGLSSTSISLTFNDYLITFKHWALETFIVLTSLIYFAALARFYDRDIPVSEFYKGVKRPKLYKFYYQGPYYVAMITAILIVIIIEYIGIKSTREIYMHGYSLTFIAILILGRLTKTIEKEKFSDIVFEPLYAFIIGIGIVITIARVDAFDKSITCGLVHITHSNMNGKAVCLRTLEKGLLIKNSEDKKQLLFIPWKSIELIKLEKSKDRSL